MNDYYINDNDRSFFEDSHTVVEKETGRGGKKAVDRFKHEITNSRYNVKRPTSKKLGHVQEQG